MFINVTIKNCRAVALEMITNESKAAITPCQYHSRNNEMNVLYLSSSNTKEGNLSKWKQTHGRYVLTTT